MMSTKTPRKTKSLKAGPFYSSFNINSHINHNLPESEFIDRRLKKEKCNIEYTVHACPRALKNEIKLVFPSLLESDLGNLHIIPTFQKTKHPLVEWNDETRFEKDEMLNNFYDWGRIFVLTMDKLGYWADIICPASGMPVFSSSGSTIYPEVEGCTSLLRYSVFSVGACNVISHPLWGMYNYPATAFASAPLEINRVFSNQIPCLKLEEYKLNLMSICQLDNTSFLIVASKFEIYVFNLDDPFRVPKNPIYKLTIPISLLISQDEELDSALKATTENSTINQLILKHASNDTLLLVAVADNGYVIIWDICYLTKPPLVLKNSESTWGCDLNSACGLLVFSSNEFVTSSVELYPILDRYYAILDIKKHEFSKKSHGSLKKPELFVKWDTVKNAGLVFVEAELRKFSGHLHNIPAVALSDNGKYIGTSSIDGTCRITEHSTGSCLLSIRIGRQWGWGVKFLDPENFDTIYSNDAEPPPFYHTFPPLRITTQSIAPGMYSSNSHNNLNVRQRFTPRRETRQHFPRLINAPSTFYLTGTSNTDSSRLQSLQVQNSREGGFLGLVLEEQQSDDGSEDNNLTEEIDFHTRNDSADPFLPGFQTRTLDLDLEEQPSDTNTGSGSLADGDNFRERHYNILSANFRFQPNLLNRTHPNLPSSDSASQEEIGSNAITTADSTQRDTNSENAAFVERTAHGRSLSTHFNPTIAADTHISGSEGFTRAPEGYSQISANISERGAQPNNLSLEAVASFHSSTNGADDEIFGNSVDDMDTFDSNTINVGVSDGPISSIGDDLGFEVDLNSGVSINGMNLSSDEINSDIFGLRYEEIDGEMGTASDSMNNNSSDYNMGPDISAELGFDSLEQTIELADFAGSERSTDYYSTDILESPITPEYNDQAYGRSAEMESYDITGNVDHIDNDNYEESENSMRVRMELESVLDEVGFPTEDENNISSGEDYDYNNNSTSVATEEENEPFFISSMSNGQSQTLSNMLNYQTNIYQQYPQAINATIDPVLVLYSSRNHLYLLNTEMKLTPIVSCLERVISRLNANFNYDLLVHDRLCFIEVVPEIGVALVGSQVGMVAVICFQKVYYLDGQFSYSMRLDSHFPDINSSPENQRLTGQPGIPNCPLAGISVLKMKSFNKHELRILVYLLYKDSTLQCFEISSLKKK